MSWSLDTRWWWCFRIVEGFGKVLGSTHIKTNVDEHAVRSASVKRDWHQKSLDFKFQSHRHAWRSASVTGIIRRYTSRSNLIGMHWDPLPWPASDGISLQARICSACGEIPFHDRHQTAIDFKLEFDQNFFQSAVEPAWCVIIHWPNLHSVNIIYCKNKQETIYTICLMYNV